MCAGARRSEAGEHRDVRRDEAAVRGATCARVDDVHRSQAEVAAYALKLTQQRAVALDAGMIG
jgi:hypothetical protein